MLHINFLTLLLVLEVNIDLRHVNHIRYYYYIIIISECVWLALIIEKLDLV